jgi:hypothetical protein
MTLLPTLASALEAAAARHARRRARARRIGLPALGVVGVLVVGGAATAATGIWSPQVGDERRGTPRIAASTVPKAQYDHFAVLRREPNAADRGPEARNALTFLSPKFDGIRTESVRFLAPGDDVVGAVILVPVERAHGARDALCLFVTDPVDGGGVGCASTAKAIAGELSLGMAVPDRPLPGSPEERDRKREWERAKRAAKARGETAIPLPRSSIVAQRLVGVVPDGVVRVAWRNGTTTITADVAENAYMIAIDDPNVGIARSTLVWLDAEGRTVRETPGAP